jgi:hypothetical protein
MKKELLKRLEDFARDKQMRGKGPLCVALVMTRLAAEKGLPLNPDDLLSERGGQVAGLGKSSVQKILKDHNIDRVLAEEGGRTSRGSVDNMRSYVNFLNDLQQEDSADLEAIEEWWAEQVRTFFSGKPFVLRLDASKSLQSDIRDLIDQAQKRQNEGSGTMYVATVMQHLVGAKLDIVMGGIQHYGSSVADEVSNRDADFVMGDTGIHVTTSPGESLIRKCERNLGNGLHPIIVTISKGVPVAQGLAEQRGVSERIDILDIEQFLCSNIYEHGNFENEGRRKATETLIIKYNEIVKEHETDPSLQIVLGK